MEQIDRVKKNIEFLRKQLNDLVETGERGLKVLAVSQQLDELVLEYYNYLNLNKTTKGH